MAGARGGGEPGPGPLPPGAAVWGGGGGGRARDGSPPMAGLGRGGNQGQEPLGLGAALRADGDYPGALSVLDEGERLQAHLSPDPELEGDLENNRGAVFYNLGRFR